MQRTRIQKGINRRYRIILPEIYISESSHSPSLAGRLSDPCNSDRNPDANQVRPLEWPIPTAGDSCYDRSGGPDSGVEMATLAAVFLAELQGLARRSGLYYVASPGWNDPKTRQDKTRLRCLSWHRFSTETTAWFRGSCGAP